MNARDRLADELRFATGNFTLIAVDRIMPLVEEIARERAATELEVAAKTAALDPVPVPCWTGQDVAWYLRDRAKALREETS